MAIKKKRLLLKLSGESLQGKKERGVDAKALKKIAREIALAYKSSRCQLSIVIGGGNIWRGVKDGGGIIDRVIADNMGMLATVINALALQSGLEKEGLSVQVMTARDMANIGELFTRRKTIQYLQKNKVLIFAGGTGNPFFTTDSAAALRASEIGADVLLKATQVDGVYCSDPKKNKKAKMIRKITYTEAIEKNLKFMDTSALALCLENQLPIRVFNLHKKDNIKKAMLGKDIGTIIY